MYLSAYLHPRDARVADLAADDLRPRRDPVKAGILGVKRGRDPRHVGTVRPRVHHDRERVAFVIDVECEAASIKCRERAELTLQSASAHSVRQ